MRIRDLFEGEMILLESYKDFSAVWQKLIQDVTQTRSVPREAITVPQRLERLLRDQRSRSFITSQELPFGTAGIRNVGDISSWLSTIQSHSRHYQGASVISVVEMFTNILEDLENFVKEEIEKRTPDYTTVAKTSSYIIFDVKNFAAAKKLRDQVGSSWCIGANEGMFKAYGGNKGRKTYIVFLLKIRKGMVIHVDASNPRDNLVTSHSNDSDGRIVDGILTYNRGVGEIERDLNDSMSSEDITNLFKSVGIKVKTSSVSKLPPQILTKFIRDLSGSDITSDILVNKSATAIKREYVYVYNSGDIWKLTKYLSSYVEDCIFSLEADYEMGSGDTKGIISNLSLIVAIASHTNELQKVDVFPKSIPSGEVVSVVEKLIHFIERDGRLPEAFPFVINTIKQYQERLEKIRRA